METVNTISALEVKKELYRKKELMAKFSHFENHKLFYIIELESGKYLFPIDTIEDEKRAADVCGAIFGLEIKASDLNRWIERAIKKDDFIKIG